MSGCNRLLLAPDGDLTRLPFEVLPDAEGRLLLEQYAISYLSCGRDMLRFGAARSGQPTEPLVVADPLFDLTADADVSASEVPIRSRCSRDLKRSDYHFPRLPGTHEEGERVAELLGVQPWLESAALEARLKERRSPRVLHLATHGFFLTDQERDPNKESRTLEMIGAEAGSIGRLSGPLPENPLLRSGLALTGAQTWLDGKSLPPDAEDGLLTAEDVTGLDLLDTELVVLSACETGLGEVRTGEGVFGLRRAFIVAGARTLVMSLWKVPDEQTRELMIDFYRRVLSGQGVADALRQAQLAMRQKHSDPYFWGAFHLSGQPRPACPLWPGSAACPHRLKCPPWNKNKSTSDCNISCNFPSLLLAGQQPAESVPKGEPRQNPDACSGAVSKGQHHEEEDKAMDTRRFSFERSSMRPIHPETEQAMSKAEMFLEHLRQEGYAPHLDDDNDVVFKYEGKTFLLSCDEEDKMFFRLLLPAFWEIESEEEECRVLKNINVINSRMKAMKLIVIHQNVWGSVELFLDPFESFKLILERCLDLLVSGMHEFGKAMREEE